VARRPLQGFEARRHYAIRKREAEITENREQRALESIQVTKETDAVFQEQPYAPSLIDRFTHWVGNLPIRAWVFYAGIGMGLVLLQVLFLWLDGGLQAVELYPVIIFNGVFTPYIPALVHYLDNQAVTSLRSMRPALDMTDPEFEQYQFKLSNMPSLSPLIAAFAVLVFVILMERLWIAPIRFAALEQLPLFAIVFHIVDKSSAFLFGPFIYHTIRQMRLVNTIHVNHVRISLFNLGPLQAFSRLTASTAVSLIVGVYGWMVINPELLTDPVSLGFIGVLTILAVVVFAWPLLGAHRLMENEKERMLYALDRDSEAVFSEFNRGLRQDDFSVVERLNGTIASLEIQRNRISAIPTWPWRPETARFALTTIALPLVLALLRFLAERAFDL
jgi:hypothetical protein